jgi:DNA-binding XRE family transcriptional regulator
LTGAVKDQAMPSDDLMRNHARQRRAGRPEPLWRNLLGHQLRRLRLSRRETLETVARRANLSLQYLSEIERGAKEPSSEVVAAISAALETTLLDLTEAVTDQLREERRAAPAPSRRGDVALAA